MPLTQNTQNQILKLIQQKIQTDQTWAEAFTKLITLDEPDQNGAIWDLLEDINHSIRWDELFEKHPEVLHKLEEGVPQSIKEGKTISLDEFLALSPENGYQSPGGNP